MSEYRFNPNRVDAGANRRAWATTPKHIRGRITLDLHEKQTEAFCSRATEILYGGAAGGGKSFLMRAAAIAWCRMIPGLQVVFFRRTYGELISNHWRGDTGFPAMLAPLVNAGKCSVVDKEIRFPNGSTIRLEHCQYAKDLTKHQGAEFHVLIIDELTTFPEEFYTYLRARVRMNATTKAGIPAHMQALFPRIFCGANPGGIGHTWVKQTFVKAAVPMAITRQLPAEGGFLRQYIPARLVDNPSLDFHSYSATLSGLKDPVLIRAMLDGDWDIVAGAMFGETWRKDLHTCDPFPIPVDWPLWFGADDGYSDPFSLHFMTQDRNTETFYVLCCIRGSHLLPEAIAAKIKAVGSAIPRWHGPGQGWQPHGDKPIPGLLDNNAFSEKGIGISHGQKADMRGQQLQKLGIKVKPVEKWNGSRIAGAMNLHRLLAPNPKCPHRLPGIRFFKGCVSAIESIPSLPRDPDDVEDVVTTGVNDHDYDSIRYALQWKIPKTQFIRMGA